MQVTGYWSLYVA